MDKPPPQLRRSRCSRTTPTKEVCDNHPRIRRRVDYSLQQSLWLLRGIINRLLLVGWLQHGHTPHIINSILIRFNINHLSILILSIYKLLFFLAPNTLDLLDLFSSLFLNWREPELIPLAVNIDYIMIRCKSLHIPLHLIVVMPDNLINKIILPENLIQQHFYIMPDVPI